jgi:hypothetical protein
MKSLSVAALAILLLLFVGARFVASDPGPQATAAESALVYAQGHVQEAHVGYYEEHLARLALEEMNCR